MNPLVSIIIPLYNEEKDIGECLRSITLQKYKPLEIILVDDGSTDGTLKLIKNLKHATKFKLFTQHHLGPGVARNLGAKNAKGEILVFVDADMTFHPAFTGDLVSPIIGGKTIGTFSKNEMNANWQNPWSACWNINRNWPVTKLIPENYPDTAPVFRAILKKEFDKVGGFDQGGQYIDDWSLSKKLNKKSTAAKGAIYYHKNPQTLSEVFAQARWIGKNDFISGSLFRVIKSLIFYSFPMSLLIGIVKSVKNPLFLPFKIVYDFGIISAVASKVFNEPKSK